MTYFTVVVTWRAAEAGQDDDGPREMAQGGGHVLRYHAWEWNMSHDGDHVSITRHSGRQNDEMIRGASWGASACVAGTS